MAEIDSLEIKIKANTEEFDKAINNLNKKMSNIGGKTTIKGTSKYKQSVDDYTKALKFLDSGISKFERGIKRTFKNVVSLNNGLKNSKNITNSLAYSFGKFYASCFLVIRGVKAIGKSIETSMNYVETYNYFWVSLNKIGEQFKDSYGDFGYDSADAYYNSFYDRLYELNNKMTGYNVGANGELLASGDKNLGIDPNQLMNFQARILAVTNSVGLIGEASYYTSDALSMLAGDLSSLTNTDLEDVMSNLQSGIIGQSKALYKYGLDITNATLEQYAFTNGVTKSVSEMSQSEKMQLRLLAILDQSKVSWGDLANTVDSSANQYRIMNQQIANLSRTIGNLFLPIVETVLPVVNGLIIAVNTLLTSLGFAVYGDDWLKNLTKNISKGNGEIEDTEDGIDGITDSVESLKYSLAGFDKLNVISSSSGSSGGSGSGNIDLTDAIAKAVLNYEEIWNKALEGAGNPANTWAEKITNALSRSLAENLGMIPWDDIFNKSQNIGETIANFLNDNINPEDFNAVGTTIANAIKTATLGKLSFSNNFDWGNLGISIAEGINGFTQNYPWEEKIDLAVSIGTGLATALNNAIDDLDVDSLADCLWGQIDAIIEGSLAFVTTFEWKDAQEKVSDLIRKLFNKMNEKTFVQGYGMKNGWEKLGIVAGQLANGIIDMLKAVPWKKVFDGIWDTVTTAFSTFAEENPISAGIVVTLLTTKIIIDSALFVAKLAAAFSGVGAASSGIAFSSTLVGAGSVAGMVGVAAIGAFVLTLGLTLSFKWITAEFEGFKSMEDWLDNFFPKDGFLRSHGIIKLPGDEGYEGSVWDGTGKSSTKDVNSIAGIDAEFEKIKESAESTSKVLKEETNTQKEIVSQLVTSFTGSMDTLSNKYYESTMSMSKNTDDLDTTVITDVDNMVQKFVTSSNDIKNIGENKFPLATGAFKNEVLDMNANLATYLSDTTSYFNTETGNMLKIVDNAFSKDKWIFNGVTDGLTVTFTKAQQAVNQIWSDIQDIFDKYGSSETGEKRLASLSMRDYTNKKLTFATGGFPEDGIFYANHSELVGQFSNGRTAVANNMQIIEGIKQGVKEALMESENSSTTVVLEGDAKGIFNIVRSEANSFTKQTGKAAFI